MRDRRTTLGRQRFTDRLEEKGFAARGVAALSLVLVGALLAALSSCAEGGDTDPTGPGAGTTQGMGGNGGGGGAGGSGGAPCMPGDVAACYSGPEGTQGLGLCVAGMMTCAEDGTGFGPCVGEVTPAQDACATMEDEDCDGVPAACPGEAVWADGA